MLNLKNYEHYCAESGDPQSPWAMGRAISTYACAQSCLGTLTKHK